jgi:hypothetical protein
MCNARVTISSLVNKLKRFPASIVKYTTGDALLNDIQQKLHPAHVERDENKMLTMGKSTTYRAATQTALLTQKQRHPFRAGLRWIKKRQVPTTS